MLGSAGHLKCGHLGTLIYSLACENLPCAGIICCIISAMVDVEVKCLSLPGIIC